MDEKISVKVENVVASSDIDRELDLDTLAGGLEHADYNPGNFPGIVYRFASPKIAVLLFETGKIVFTGGDSVDKLYEAVDIRSGGQDGGQVERGRGRRRRETGDGSSIAHTGSMFH